MLTTYRYSPVPAPRAQLASSVSLVFTSASSVQAVSLREGQPLVVGRGAPSDVVIDDVSMSRSHARFQLIGGTIHVEDLGSTNGTLLDGKPIVRATLAPEQSARLGGVEVGIAGHARALPEQATPVSSFGSAVRDELVRARFFGRSFAVVAVMSSSSERAGDALQRMLRPVDVLEQQAPHLALLLLPEASELEVLSLAEALHRSEPGLHRVGASVFPTLASSAEELIADSLRAARDARVQQVNFSRRVEPEPSARAAGEPIVIAASMKRVHALIASAARTTIPVLIAGETGSGKESLATAVHLKSARSKGPFKTVNCAALPSTLISATLFGHEKGAFTGADRQSQGLFEQAHGGTLFLDEVGELSLEAQAALLRALETKRIVRVGGNKEIEVDVRLVAATHRDLSAMVATGTFREDLLYRLDAFTVRVPPLRERREEIIPLAQHFLALSQERWQSSATKLAEVVGQTLESYAWPGNARQLRNVIERAAAVCTGRVIELDDLPDAVFDASRPPAHSPSQASVSTTPGLPSSLPDRLRQIEEQILREALEKAGGNQSEAARLLGLPRRTLAHKAHAYGLAGTG